MPLVQEMVGKKVIVARRCKSLRGNKCCHEGFAYGRRRRLQDSRFHGNDLITIVLRQLTIEEPLLVQRLDGVTNTASAVRVTWISIHRTH